MTPTSYQVLEEFGMLLILAAMCGGSSDVRYGRKGPETRYVADLSPTPNELIWLFVRLPGEGRIAAQVEWSNDLWTILSSNGVQTADCPTEIWAGSPRFFRTENIPKEPLTFEEAMRRHLECNPGSVHTAEFRGPA